MIEIATDTATEIYHDVDVYNRRPPGSRPPVPIPNEAQNEASTKKKAKRSVRDME